MNQSVLFILFGTLLCPCLFSEQEPIKVSVYYEIMCPHCQAFLPKQLIPTYRQFRPYMKLDLIPYGKANSTYVHDHWEYTCQHGPDECYGNKVHACILNAESISEDSKLDFISCNLDTPKPVESIEKCAKEANINWKELNTKCVSTQLGDAYLVANGVRTHQLQPKLDHIPTIIYNDVFNATLDQESSEDFKKVFCSLLSDPKPTDCANELLPIVYML